MPKLAQVSVRLLGVFAVEAKTARTSPVLIRSRKARALFAYLAMKPDYRASREEVATLLWSDSLDAHARHSLSQCLTSLRQDLRLAPELLFVEREMIGIRAKDLSVDTRELLALAKSSKEEDLERAAELYRGEFLSDLTLDIEEFDSWGRQQRDLLAAAAARAFEALSRYADERGEGERAIDTAERLVALDSMREDWQRIALGLYARYRGREAALSRAKAFTELLKSDLGVAPDEDTRAMIDAIRRGEVPPAHPADRGKSEARLPRSSEGAPVENAVIAVAGEEPHPVVPPTRSLAHGQSESVAAKASVRDHRWAGVAAMVALVFGTLGALVFAPGSQYLLQLAAPQSPAALDAIGPVEHPPPDATALTNSAVVPVVVLPFTVGAGQVSQDRSIAEALTHDLIGYLARYPALRVISNHTSDLYRDRQVDVATIGAELGVHHAIVGHVQGDEGRLTVTFHLVDTATRLELWSDHVQRERGEPMLVADEITRGIARALNIQITYAQARRDRNTHDPEVEISDLIARGRAAEQLGPRRESLSEALRLFDQALQRYPHYIPAMVGVARVEVVAANNLVELDPPVDLDRAERLLKAVLEREPNSAPAHYNLGLLQKHRRQYEASIQSFQRALELNPSFLASHAQIGVLLTRLGRVPEGFERIQYALRVGPKEPARGYWYEFAGQVELDLRHYETALDWFLRADAFMPGCPVVQLWIVSAYAALGDDAAAAKYAAAFKKLAPSVAQSLLEHPAEHSIGIALQRINLLERVQRALSARPS
jgi:DNA-binding SARP family transcriptional activator/TolB-like protein